MAAGKLGGPALPPEMDRGGGDRAGRGGGICADLPDRFTVSEGRALGFGDTGGNGLGIETGTDLGVENEGGTMKAFEQFSDADFKRTILNALRLLAILTAVAAPVLAWKLGWKSAALLLVGAAISGSGLWEWLRLMTAVMVRMDAGAEAKPLGMVLLGFF